MYTKTDLSIPIKTEHMNVIIGTVLGDATITKSRHKRQTASLRFSHSMKQLYYCQHKAERLAIFACKGVVTPTYFIKSRQKYYQSARFETRYTRELYDLYTMFYKSGKKIIPKGIGSFMNPEILAYWYMDDGSISKRNEKRNGQIYYIRDEIALHTNGFLKKDVLILQKIMKDVFDLDFRIKMVDYGQHPILVTKSRIQIEQMIEIIRPYIHSSMFRKITTHYQKPMRKSYSKTKLIRICRKLQINKWKDFQKYRNGNRLYESVRWFFGSVSNLRQNSGS